MREAVDYGFIPENIRSQLQPNSFTVSKQIMELITSGRIGPEGFIPSIQAAFAESQLYANTAPNRSIEEEQRYYTDQYKGILKSPKLQQFVCRAMIDECNQKILKAIAENDRMKSRFYLLGSRRWCEVLKSIKDDSKIPRPVLRLVRPGQ